jgi:hypothetical protein
MIQILPMNPNRKFVYFFPGNNGIPGGPLRVAYMASAPELTPIDPSILNNSFFPDPTFSFPIGGPTSPITLMSQGGGECHGAILEAN